MSCPLDNNTQTSDFKRRDIRKFFNDNDEFGRSEAEKWLNSVGYDNDKTTNMLDNLFKDDKVYSSSTKFIGDIKNSLDDDETNPNRTTLSDAELKDIFQINTEQAHHDNHQTPPQEHNAMPQGNNNLPNDDNSEVNDVNDSNNQDTSPPSPDQEGYKRFDDSTQMQYDKLPRGFNGSIPTDDADYIAIIKSGGRDPKKAINEDSFRASGGNVVGMTGSADKGILLLDTRGQSDINIDVGESAVQFVRIKTDKNLQVDNNGGGALDPSLGEGNRLIATEAGSDFSIYGDDESKYSDRVKELQAASTVDFYNGDDSAYILSSGENAGNKGNGSIMQISYV